MTTLSAIKKSLVENDSGYAVDMVAAMERRAELHPDYAASLATWLRNGGTVRLRETLCRCFENADFVKNLAPTLPCAWFNCFAAIDSAGLATRGRSS